MIPTLWLYVLIMHLSLRRDDDAQIFVGLDSNTETSVQSFLLCHIQWLILFKFLLLCVCVCVHMYTSCCTHVKVR